MEILFVSFCIIRRSHTYFCTWTCYIYKRSHNGGRLFCKGSSFSSLPSILQRTKTVYFFIFRFLKNKKKQFRCCKEISIQYRVNVHFKSIHISSYSSSVSFSFEVCFRPLVESYPWSISSKLFRTSYQPNKVTDKIMQCKAKSQSEII